MDKISRRTWKKDNLYITYGNPCITPHRENLVESMEDVMYFYYNIKILDGKKTLFNASTHDFPKVQNLPIYIDYILDMKEEDMFVYEDYEDNGFHRKKLYNFIVLDDSFNMDIEYFYKIERTITYVKQRDSKDFKRYEEFTLTIGQNAPNKEGYSNGEDFGQSVFIKYLTREDMLNLKRTAREFCKSAIEDYNKELKEYKIKCPKCEQHQLYLDALTDKENDYGDCFFKCCECEHNFSSDDNYYID